MGSDSAASRNKNMNNQSSHESSAGPFARWVVLPLLGALLILATFTQGRADVVIFKDGFTLQGKIKREMTNFVDPGSGQQLSMAKLNGFFMIDDEARRVI